MVVIEILVQKMHTVGGCVACDIFLMGGQPYVTVCDRGGVKFGPKKYTNFFEWSLIATTNYYHLMLKK